MILLTTFVATTLAAYYLPVKNFNISWTSVEDVTDVNAVKTFNFTLKAKVDGYIALGFAKEGELARDYVGGWFDKKKSQAFCGDFDVKSRVETKRDSTQARPTEKEATLCWVLF